VFQIQDQLTSRPNRTVNNVHYRDLLSRLVNHAQGGPSFVFTVNQDRLFERLLSHQSIPIHRPGMQPLQPDHNGSYEVQDARAQFPTSGLNYVKLHGSFDWPLHGRPVLLAGEQKKEEIDRNRLLSSYFEIFEEALDRPRADLLVIGYSFSDTHINQLLAGVIRADTRFFIVDPGPMGNWAGRMASGGFGRLVRHTRGYWQWTLSEIFPQENSTPQCSPFYKDIIQAFLEG
jgi:hypothetical protein